MQERGVRLCSQKPYRTAKQTLSDVALFPILLVEYRSAPLACRLLGQRLHVLNGKLPSAFNFLKAS
jgi:hypothetical protein